MKAVTINRGSWHFKLLRNFGLDQREMDLCLYIRRMLIAFVLASLIALACLGALVLVGNFLAWVAYCLYAGTLVPANGPTSAVLAILALASLVGVVRLIVKGLTAWSEHRYYKNIQIKQDPNYKEPEPSFVEVAYTTIKQKTCFKVEFK